MKAFKIKDTQTGLYLGKQLRTSWSENGGIFGTLKGAKERVEQLRYSLSIENDGKDTVNMSLEGRAIQQKPSIELSNIVIVEYELVETSVHNI